MFSSRTNWTLSPNRLAIHLDERRRQGLSILDLTESNPTRCGFDFDQEAILDALRSPRSLVYEPEPRGLLAARAAVAGYYAERGARVDPQQIFLTTSTSEAYSYVFRLLADPGDAILAPRPSYPLFDFLTRLNDVELVHYPLVLPIDDPPRSYPLADDRGWQIDLEAIEKSLSESSRRVRAILAVHPNNPTGSFVRPAELDFLLTLCGRHQLALITDEVFADYAFDEKVSPAASHVGVSRALTFTLSGLSKISALPQMKLAWLVANGPPDDLAAALARLEVIADTYLSVSAPLQHALPSLLVLRRQVQPQILARLRQNLAWLDRRLAAELSVMRLPSEGGWYAILRVPSSRTDEDWAVELLTRDGVMVHPGHFYDFVSEGHLVVSLLPAPEIFQAGVQKVLARMAFEG
ncbi:MAG TPA: pyridoxal phosphate-dependent aminotransferase [Terriglobia bacterium]|nr:pyridoxal phosphate-dependent aminotransferase [Terriglobia bacterium]